MSGSTDDTVSHAVPTGKHVKGDQTLKTHAGNNERNGNIRMRTTLDWNQYGATRLLSRDRLRLPHHRLFMESFIDFFEDIPLDACCLDIGCADGHFLEILRMLGFQNLSGLDPSRHAVQRARTKGLDVKTGSVYALSEGNGTYDVVLLLDVLEHLEAPLQALEIIQNILKPHGILYLNVPVCDSFHKRVERMLQGKTKHQQMVEWDTTHRHTYSSHSLKTVCIKAGLHPIRQAHISNPFPFVKRVSLKSAVSLQRFSFGGRFGDFCSLICQKSNIQ